MLSIEDAIWAADQFIEYYSKFNRIDDYLRFVKQSRMDNASGKLFGPEDEIFSNFISLIYLLKSYRKLRKGD